jgi:hypothetical protein
MVNFRLSESYLKGLESLKAVVSNRFFAKVRSEKSANEKIPVKAPKVRKKTTNLAKTSVTGKLPDFQQSKGIASPNFIQAVKSIKGTKELKEEKEQKEIIDSYNEALATLNKYF